jgi:hypothetical protein
MPQLQPKHCLSGRGITPRTTSARASLTAPREVLWTGPETSPVPFRVHSIGHVSSRLETKLGITTKYFTMNGHKDAENDSTYVLNNAHLRNTTQHIVHVETENVR